MRFLGFMADGVPTIGRLDPSDRSLVQAIAPIDDFYASADPAALLRAPFEGDSVARVDITEVPAVPLTSRVLCLGQNYLDHVNEIKEVGRKAPDFPNIFARWASTLSVHEGTVGVPPGDGGLDWEAELALIIGAPMGPTPVAAAMDSILGYTAFNDITARKLQKAVSQWTLGKNGDRTGPLGPDVVTPDELGDPNNLAISSRVNGETMQDANTSLMMFKIDVAISYITQAMTLRPGDVIAMGTPAGVGAGQTPPRFMHAGDEVDVEIEKIGVLTTRVI